MARYLIEFGGRLEVEADDKDDAMSEFLSELGHPASGIVNIRRVARIEDDEEGIDGDQDHQKRQAPSDTSGR